MAQHDAFGASTWIDVDGYNAHWDLNMDLTAVPAAWLFGSGLIGLVAVARRKA